MSFEVPEDRRYAETHEWAEPRDGVVRVGITDFAQDELGDIVFVEFPDEGESLAAGADFGTIESIKAVSDLYLPVGGEVVAVNERLLDHPELVNADPYGDGWLVEVDPADEADLDALLSPAAYREQTE